MDITVSDFTIPDWHYGGSTAKLRLYSSIRWTDSNDVPHIGGTAGAKIGFYQEVPCTIVNNVVLVPSFVTPSTLDARDFPNVRISAVLFDHRNTARDTLFSQWFIPTSFPTLAWSVLSLVNLGSGYVNPPITYLNRREVEELVAAAIGQGVANASSVIKGKVRLSVPPLLSNDPVALGENDPRLRNLQNIEAFGAVGDGVTDCAPAINAAIIKANSVQGGLFIPVGVYKINSGIFVNCPVVFSEGLSQIYTTAPIGITFEASNIYADAHQHFANALGVFEGQGFVAFTGNSNLDFVMPTWWGGGALAQAAAAAALATANNRPIQLTGRVNPISRLISANEYFGGDVGARINAADAELGTNPGEIYIYGGGTISTQIVLSENHVLHLGAGTYTSDVAGAPILMKSDTTLYGDGWDTIIQETSSSGGGTNHFIVIANHAAYFSNGSTQRNMFIRDLQIQGVRTDFNSALETITLGNVHRAIVENVYLNATHCIGIQAGGAATLGSDPLGLGRYAEDVIIKDCLFVNVASQNVAFVNAKDSTIIDNIFMNPGQTGGPGSTAIDVEVNDPANDLADNIIIKGNIMDARNSPLNPHGNFIAYQPATASKSFVITGNIALSNFLTSNGIITNTNPKQGLISNNLFIGMGQSGIFFQGIQTKICDNFLIDTGTAGAPSIRLNNAQRVDVTSNTTLNPVLGGGAIVEQGTSNFNSIQSNTLQGSGATITLVGASSVAGVNIISLGTYVNKLNFPGSVSGTTTMQAAAAAGTTTLTLPAATDTLVGKATTDTLTNKTLTSPVLTTPTLGVATGTSVTTSSVLSSTGGVSNWSKGTDVASTATITATGNLFHVTGTTNITSVSGSGIAAGTRITIIFDGVLTFTDGSNLKLAGNFVTTADDTITLAYDGTNWYEICRSTN